MGVHVYVPGRGLMAMVVVVMVIPKRRDSLARFNCDVHFSVQALCRELRAFGVHGFEVGEPHTLIHSPRKCNAMWFVLLEQRAACRERENSESELFESLFRSGTSTVTDKLIV